MPGFFKVERDFLESSLWLSEPFTRGQAWVDLFGSANHAEGYFFKRGIKVVVLRTQLGKSELTLADRWQWSRNKVRRFLKWLEDEGMLSLKKDNKTTLITICNYELYQGRKKEDDTPNDTPNDTPEGHQKDTRRNTIKKKENVDNVKKKENILKPEKVTDQTWNDFLAHRKNLKTPITQTVINNFLKESVLAGISLEDALIESITRGWRGFKADWVKNKSFNKDTPNEKPNWIT